MQFLVAAVAVIGVLIVRGGYCWSVIAVAAICNVWNELNSLQFLSPPRCLPKLSKAGLGGNTRVPPCRELER